MAKRQSTDSGKTRRAVIGDAVPDERGSEEVKAGRAASEDAALASHDGLLPATRGAKKHAERLRERWARKTPQFTTVPERPAPTVFDVPLARGGPVALLMVANLDTSEEVKLLRGMHSHDGEPATIDQLRDAQKMGRLISLALFGGQKSDLWGVLPPALNDLLGVQKGRRAVIELANSLLNFRKRTEEFLQAGGTDPTPDAWDREIERTIAILREVDVAFAALGREVVVSLFQGTGSPKNIEGIGLAVKLSMACGAFGDAKPSHETTTTAVKRVRRNYEKALESLNNH
jgi:hypothetical protein